MMISIISRGSLVIGGERVTEVPGETLVEHVLRILARPRYQTRLTSSSIAVVDRIQSVN